MCIAGSCRSGSPKLLANNSLHCCRGALTNRSHVANASAAHALLVYICRNMKQHFLWIGGSHIQRIQATLRCKAKRIAQYLLIPLAMDPKEYTQYSVSWLTNWLTQWLECFSQVLRWSWSPHLWVSLTHQSSKSILPFLHLTSGCYSRHLLSRFEHVWWVSVPRSWELCYWTCFAAATSELVIREELLHIPFNDLSVCHSTSEQNGNLNISDKCFWFIGVLNPSYWLADFPTNGHDICMLVKQDFMCFTS